MFLLLISAIHMSALVLNQFISFWILIFLLIVTALYCFLFANKLHPLPLPVGIIVTI
jgi:hypothetical protein